MIELIFLNFNFLKRALKSLIEPFPLITAKIRGSFVVTAREEMLN